MHHRSGSLEPSQLALAIAIADEMKWELRRGRVRYPKLSKNSIIFLLCVALDVKRS